MECKGTLSDLSPEEMESVKLNGIGTRHYRMFKRRMITKLVKFGARFSEIR